MELCWKIRQMERSGEHRRKPFYERTFYEIDENSAMGIDNWLREEAGNVGENWNSYFLGRYYYQCGYEQSDVGVIGDLHVEIYDPETAFRFELFKVGGRARENKPSGYDPYDDIFDSIEEDFIDE